MGKIRVKTIGDEGQETEEKQKNELKRAEKKAREASVEEKTEDAETSTDSPVEAEQVSEAEVAPTNDQTEETPQKKAKKEKFLKKANRRSTTYNTKAMQIEDKNYSLDDAIELLKKIKSAKFDETVELHINTIEAGISGTLKLPHGTGKEVRVVIADDALLAEIEKGKINFDILLATPSMMPKLGKVARVLGPKGLMPNPKNGTITENPEEAMKNFQGGQMSFKTENKIPVIHVSVGKVSFTNDQLNENIKTVINAIKKARIKDAFLKSTMSPAIRVQA